jgi:PfaB family protein
MTQIAIIGLDAQYGSAQGREAFARAIYAGELLSVGGTAVPPALQTIVRVAGNALADGRPGLGGRTAVLTQEARVGRAIANKWGLSGPVCDLSPDAVLGALAQARVLLVEGQADSVLLVSVESIGAGAVVLALDGQQPAYATIAACQIGREAASMALAEAGIAPDCVGLMDEVQGVPDDSLLNAYRRSATYLTCAFGSSSATIGQPSAMASLIKMALFLHRRTLPPTHGWTGLESPERWTDTPFYVVPEARPWFVEPFADRRFAALNGGDAHVILAEPPRRREEKPIRSQPGAVPTYLLPIGAATFDALVARLRALQARLEAGDDLSALANEMYREYAGLVDSPYALAIVEHDRAGLLSEVRHAFDGVRSSIQTGNSWVTPRGSAFTAEPLGAAGVVFVYPGAFNSYINLGHDLFQHFTGLHDRLAVLLSNPGRSVAGHMVYPRSLAPLSDDDLNGLTAQLNEDPITLVESGTTFAMLYTMLIRDIFGVRPRAMLGYSLGEISMLWAGGVWANPDAGSANWHASPLFKTRLFGRKQVVREQWGLRDDQDDDFWHNYVLKAPADDVRAAVEGEPRVYVTLINLINEVVIAGDPAGCLRVIGKLHCHSLQIPFSSVLHNELVWSERDEFLILHTNPVQLEPDVAFYSAANYAPLNLESEALAHDLTLMIGKTIDFPRLINTVYNDGARLFIELGPLGTSSRCIRRVLNGRPHAVLPINKKGADDFEQVLAVLALLICHRVPVNLAPLYEPEPQGNASQTTAVQPVIAGLDDQFRENLTRHVSRVTEAHEAFLHAQGKAIKQIGAIIEMQCASADDVLNTPRHDRQVRGIESAVDAASHTVPMRSKPFLDEAAIRAFTADSLADYLPEYAIYSGRRIPHLPGGDLLLVSRVMKIDGKRGQATPGAAILSEYDVPVDAWYYGDGKDIPYSILMEIALQPCGILSTYLGSILSYPDADFHFRNLDGQGHLLRVLDVRGKTICNRVTLLSSTAIQGIIIQKFGFELVCEGTPLFRGDSSFGYFMPEALDSQSGIDRAIPWMHERNAPGKMMRLAPGRLALLDVAQVVPGGGSCGLGYVYAEAPISSTDWFFKCHFYQDPVMPGSLGVEALRQALAVFAEERGIAGRASLTPDQRTTWKYRGQIPPDVLRIHLEAHVTDLRDHTLVADASIWREALRIYEVNDLAITLKYA